MAANLRLFLSGDFADIIVKCQNREWKVHRAIICQHSRYFETMCKSGFIVRSSRPQYERCSNSRLLGKHHERDYLTRRRTAMVERMLLYLYASDYSTASTTCLQSNTILPDLHGEEELNAVLATHVRMYAMADKYIIPSLSVVAKSKFAARVQEMWPISGLPGIANEVFTSVSSCDRELKDIILKICVSHATEIVSQLTSKHPTNNHAHNSADSIEEGLKESTWSSVLGSNGELATEILTHVVQSTDEELGGLREMHEDTVGAMQKLQDETEVEKKRYADLLEEFADYRSHVNHMMDSSVKGRPCNCNGGFKFRFTQGTRAKSQG